MQSKILQALVIILISINFSSCQRQIEYVLPPQNAESTNSTSERFEYDDEQDPINRSQIETIEYDYPSHLIETRHSQNSVLVQDTDQDIVLSTGFVPDDYYMPNGFVNDEKYAEQYILIQLQEYDYQIDSENDWQGFIEKHFPEIKSYRSYALLSHLRAIEPIEFYGVILGNKIVIISVNDKVIAAHLHYQARNSEEANQNFEAILNSLR